MLYIQENLILIMTSRSNLSKAALSSSVFLNKILKINSKNSKTDLLLLEIYCRLKTVPNKIWTSIYEFRTVDFRFFAQCLSFLIYQFFWFTCHVPLPLPPAYCSIMLAIIFVQSTQCKVPRPTHF